MSTTSLTADAVRQGASMATAPLQRRALRDDVYDSVLNMLLAGEIAPGESIGIYNVARVLGVSQTPVREAMAQLEHTGLVERTALKGYRVAPPLPPEAMVELIDARSVVEIAAAHAAAADVAALLPELRAAHEAHQGATTALETSLREEGATASLPQLRAYFDADWAFHVTVFRHSGNRFLLQMSEQLGSHLHRLRQTAGHASSDARQALAEHEHVLDGFASADPLQGATRMQEHLANVRARVVADG